MSKNQEKLSQKDFDRMWGEEGPYSQVRLSEETRILDDRISRIFLVVEAEINPFTFECIKKHREYFAEDEPVIQFLDHAEYRGEFGYVVSAGEVEFCDEDSKSFARKQADMAIDTLIRIHTFVMEKYKLRQNKNFGIIEDEKRFVWNENTMQVEEVESELWESETFVGSPAGIRNNKIRFFIVFAYEKNFDFKKEIATVLAQTLKRTSLNFKVDIESCESFREYMLTVALLPFEIVPSDFIETILGAYNKVAEKPMFKGDYLVTNVKKPTQEQIVLFLKQLR